MALFGTSGIRGVVGKEITPELALGLGRRIVKNPGLRVVVGRDARASGMMLEDALVSGIIEAGGIAVRIGIAPTPATALAVKNHGDCGVMITASHNPPEYNGFKLFGPGGKEAGKDEEERIERALLRKDGFEPRGAGREERVSTAISEHIRLALSLVDVDLITKKAPKVVVDCGNGAGSVETPYALRMAGCRVFAVNAEPSGIFARGLEPCADNLVETGRMVKALGADLGIAHDGDADRAIAIDENGEVLGLDAQLALACGDEIARNGGKGAVVSTIEAGLAVKGAVERAGGKLVVTRVGSLHCMREMEKSKAVFAGEPCGEYIFKGGAPAPDGIAAALKLVESWCRRGSLAEARKAVPQNPMRRAKYPSKDKAAAMERIAPEIRKAFAGSVFAEDGIRVDFAEGWVLVRASGTEPIVRITAEAETDARLADVFSKAEAIVKKHA